MARAQFCPSCGPADRVAGSGPDRRVVCPACGQKLPRRRGQRFRALAAAPRSEQHPAASRRVERPQEHIRTAGPGWVRPLPALAFPDHPVRGALVRNQTGRKVILAGLGILLIVAVVATVVSGPGRTEMAQGVEVASTAPVQAAAPAASLPESDPLVERSALFADLGDLTAPVSGAVREQGERDCAERAKLAHRIFLRDCELLFEEEKQLAAAYEKQVQARYARMSELGMRSRNLGDVQKVIQLARDAERAARNLLAKLDLVQGRARQLAKKSQEDETPYAVIWSRYTEYLTAKLRVAYSKQAFFTFEPSRSEYLPSVERINDLENELRSSFQRFTRELEKAVPPGQLVE